MSFVGEIKRRKVFQVAAVYAVVAWLLVQIIVSIEEPLNLPGWVDTFVIVLLAFGFPITLIISWAFNLTPEGLVPDGGGATAAPSGGRRIEYLLIGLLVIAVGWIGYSELSPSGQPAPQVMPNSVAVLLCDNFSTDPANEFFAVSLHEEIRDQLAKIQNLNVTSRRSVLQYAGAESPITEIANELGVESVMECSVAYGEGRIVISAQLIDGDTGLNMWSDRYNREFKDNFGIQADIAMNVANALEVTFSVQEQQSIESVPTDSARAYELYLAANHAFRNASLDNGVRALGLLDQALAIDSQFVQAWASKANVHVILSGFRIGGEARTELEMGIDAARRAADIGLDSGRGSSILGYAMQQAGEWVNAEREYRRAQELGVNLAAVASYSVLQMAVGNFAVARDTLLTSSSNNPMNDVAAGFLLAAHEMTGGTAMRNEGYERGEELYGEWFGDMIETLLRIGERDVEFLREQLPEQLSNDPIYLAFQANFDSPADGIRALRTIYQDEANRSSVNLVNLSSFAAYFGDRALALAWMREAAELSPANFMYAWLPVFEDVRREPGFEILVDDLGFPEHWRAYGWPEFCQPINDDDFECG